MCSGTSTTIQYVAWMQDIAIEHSAAQGWLLERYVENGTAWVVRSHLVHYKRPALASDEIGLFTWVADFRSRGSLRRYLFRRVADRRVLAEAETDWAYVDLETFRPRAIPAELSSSFERVENPDRAALDTALEAIGR
jgi:acyl-CoA thioester hydrolase